MHPSLGFATFTCLLLAACSGPGALLPHPYTAPTTGPTAKIRVITNGQVHFIPNHSCLDWNAQDEGLVASTDLYVGPSPSHNGEALGMLAHDGPLTPAGGNPVVTAEVAVRGDMPLAVFFLADSRDGTYHRWCPATTLAFVPEANAEYEIIATLDPRQCQFFTQNLSNPGLLPVQRFTRACR